MLSRGGDALAKVPKLPTQAEAAEAKAVLKAENTN